MKWALKKDGGDKVAVAFADLTKAQAAHMLLAYLEIEKKDGEKK